jgi:hypothetical protein
VCSLLLHNADAAGESAGDSIISLLGFLDIETYESAMGVLLKEGVSDDIFFRHG